MTDIIRVIKSVSNLLLEVSRLDTTTIVYVGIP